MASGSSGNAALVSCGDTHLLLDAGISLRRIRQSLAELDLAMEDIDALLITHSHKDHICALSTLLKHHALPIYATRETAWELSSQYAGIDRLLRPFDAGARFTVGAFSVDTFSTVHDTAGSVCYRIESADGAVGLLTDTAYVTEQAFETLRGVDFLMLEANHDVERLCSGSYPPALKERIMRSGHLSNEEAACFAVSSVSCGTRDILLIHLSAENNTSELAVGAVQRALRAQGREDISVSAAPRREMSPVHILEQAGEKKWFTLR